MKTIIIKSINDSSQIYEEILDNLNSFNLQSVSVNLKEDHLTFEVLNNEETYIDFLSQKISTHVVENIQPRMIREEVMIDFEEFFDESVEEFIKKLTWKLVYKDQDYYSRLIFDIKEQIKNCLLLDSFFNLDGFVQFRLNNKRKDIRDSISEELEHILDEDEFDNFINLLKQYIAIKLPENDLIHFVMVKDKDYEFITGDRNKIDLKEIENVCNELENSLEYEIDDRDFILGVIMTLAPKKIIIHTNHKQDPQVVYMLNKLYGKRVSECHGCEFCESIRINKKKSKKNDWDLV